MVLIHELIERVQRSFPDVKLRVDEPAHPDGFWHVDISRAGKTLVVQWTGGGPFGLASLVKGRGLGEKPDELYQSLDDAADRVLKLLATGSRTAPPPEVTLRELR